MAWLNWGPEERSRPSPISRQFSRATAGKDYSRPLGGPDNSDGGGGFPANLFYKPRSTGAHSTPSKHGHTRTGNNQISSFSPKQPPGRVIGEDGRPKKQHRSTIVFPEWLHFKNLFPSISHRHNLFTDSFSRRPLLRQFLTTIPLKTGGPLEPNNGAMGLKPRQKADVEFL